METKTINQNEVMITIIHSNEVVINDGQSALDFFATMYYEHNCNCIVINKEAICEDFFKLATGVAGEVLQKVSNYHMRFAVVGDFSGYTSKSLKDFIYESNKVGQVLFVKNEEDAIDKFGGKCC